MQGITPLRLGTAVPPVGGWRLAALPPPALMATDVQLLLDSCDRRSAVGSRDFAIMMPVARLGLRSIEVARLELRDGEWRTGELVVCGKEGRWAAELNREALTPLSEALGDVMASGHLVGALATASQLLSANTLPAIFVALLTLTALVESGRSPTSVHLGQMFQ